MNDKVYRIFVINPGSTSTKVELFENETSVMETDVFHDSTILRTFPSINDQLDYRMQVIDLFMKENHIDLSGIDAVVGRGGPSFSMPGGIYEIDERLIRDTRDAKGGLYHSSMLGVQMAEKIHERYGGIMLMVDPPVVDELQDIARITGVRGIYRKAANHALNLKETARRHAAEQGKKYEEMNLIVCHIDGGISITAHEKGRMIDVNDAGGGEGPFTPTRMGTMSVTDVLNNLFDKDPSYVRSLCSQAGGFSSWFNTSNSDTIHKMVEDGDPKAVLIWNAMIYQVCKWIGMMAPVLKGNVDSIVLTGGLLRFPEIEEIIRDRCGWIAPVYSYPGEFEHEAMCSAALRVLRGEEKPSKYTGRPVFEGFGFE